MNTTQSTTTEEVRVVRTVWGWNVVQGTAPGSCGVTHRTEEEAHAEAAERRRRQG